MKINIQELAGVIFKAGEEWMKQQPDDVMWDWADAPDEVFAQAAADNVIEQLIRIRQTEEEASAINGDVQTSTHELAWLKSIKEQQ